MSDVLRAAQARYANSTWARMATMSRSIRGVITARADAAMRGNTQALNEVRTAEAFANIFFADLSATGPDQPGRAQPTAKRRPARPKTTAADREWQKLTAGLTADSDWDRQTAHLFRVH